jgi:hypothetical protein
MHGIMNATSATQGLSIRKYCQGASIGVFESGKTISDLFPIQMGGAMIIRLRTTRTNPQDFPVSRQTYASLGWIEPETTVSLHGPLSPD